MRVGVIDGTAVSVAVAATVTTAASSFFSIGVAVPLSANYMANNKEKKFIIPLLNNFT